MKKLLLLTIVFIPLILSGQKNTIYFIHQPTDMGVGLRYERQITNWGFYVSESRGTYHLDEQVMRNHYKTVAGVVRHNPGATMFSAGLSYHHYGDPIPKASFPVSFEFGAAGKIEWFNAGFSFDPIKWEGTFMIGVSF